MTSRLARAASAAVLALALVSCGSAADEAQETAAAPVGATPTAASTDSCPTLEPAEPVRDGLPDLTLPCLGDGPAVNLADLRGKPTVVNVWAAWCTNCDREMPLFAEAVRQAGAAVQFIGVHYKAPRAYGLQSELDFGLPFPSVHDEDGDLVVSRLQAYAPPQTFFVTADGRIAGRKIGEISSAEELSDLLQRHLGVNL